MTNNAPLTPDNERWGVALAVIQQHGEDAQAYAIGRMRHFATMDDHAGIRFWLNIGHHIHDLAAEKDMEATRGEV